MGKETKATQFLDPARTPQRQKCIVFPSTKTAVLIPFHVKCFAPDEVHSPLFYKFFLFDSGTIRSLLTGFDKRFISCFVGRPLYFLFDGIAYVVKLALVVLTSVLVHWSYEQHYR